jgi:hypothetical protein
MVEVLEQDTGLRSSSTVVTTLATQALIPDATGRHWVELVPHLSSQDGAGRVQLKDFGPTRNRKVVDSG